MRQLLLLRHAKSSWDDPKLPDHARPLNPRGRRAAEAVRDILVGLGAAPELVLVSSARRTLQTLAALEPWPVPPRVEPLDALYLASATDMLAVLRESGGDAGCIMLVGHNPGLHELVLLLAAEISDPDQRAILEVDYPTAALALLTIDGTWSGLLAGTAVLRRLICPGEPPNPR